MHGLVTATVVVVVVVVVRTEVPVEVVGAIEVRTEVIVRVGENVVVAVNDVFVSVIVAVG